MKYYHLKLGSDIKEIGKLPQCETFVKPGNLIDLNQVDPLMDLPDLPEPKLMAKAKPTTLLDASVVVNSLQFLTVKKDFVEFLQNFLFGVFKSWPIKVHHKNSVLDDYEIFYLPNTSQNQYVDYESSLFYASPLGEWKLLNDPNYKRKYVDISNDDECKQIAENLRSAKLYLKTEKLVLNLKTAKEDLFRLSNLPYTGNGYYVSEKLKKGIEDKGYTGILFEEIEKDQKIEITY